MHVGLQCMQAPHPSAHLGGLLNTRIGSFLTHPSHFAENAVLTACIATPHRWDRLLTVQQACFLVGLNVSGWFLTMTVSAF